MNRCPITYKDCGSDNYSVAGLKKLSPKLKQLLTFPYTAAMQRKEAVFRASKMSIQGVQPKVSASLNIKKQVFEIVDTGGQYIIKPQSNLYNELPQNEDLTMRLAADIGLMVPLHGLMYSKDNSFSYFIKRFDRVGKKKKIPLEDFAQLSGQNRETKYDYSMEKIVTIIDKFCTFPTIEKAILFKLVIFNFLTGNEDMHLKNFSLITNENKTQLSPMYDLLNTTIAMPGATEEIALPIRGKKKKLNYKLLVDYYALERLLLSKKIIDKILEEIFAKENSWSEIVKNSFLSPVMKQKYLELYVTRKKILLRG